jgi:hypothetical protein
MQRIQPKCNSCSAGERLAAVQDDGITWQNDGKGQLAEEMLWHWNE